MRTLIFAILSTATMFSADAVHWSRYHPSTVKASRPVMLEHNPLQPFQSQAATVLPSMGKDEISPKLQSVLKGQIKTVVRRADGGMVMLAGRMFTPGETIVVNGSANIVGPEYQLTLLTIESRRIVFSVTTTNPTSPDKPVQAKAYYQLEPFLFGK